MIDKIKTLVLARHFVIKGLFDIAYDDDPNTDGDYIVKWTNYFDVISELLGINISLRDVQIKDFDVDKLISYPIKSAVYEDALDDLIFENFGFEESILYRTFTNIITLHYVTSLYTYDTNFENIPKDRAKLILSEYEFGDEYFEYYKEKYSHLSFIHHKYFNKESIVLFEKLNSTFIDDKFNPKEANKITSDLLSELFPRFAEIEIHLGFAEFLITELEKTRPGTKDWKAYENICFDILQYLFIPEFDIIYPQIRTHDGHQIRDAIIPNNAHFGFWKNIKDEFSSKNIVCEFKNGIKKNVSKDSINQLRIYLSKKTIGKFGLLFIRRSPSKSLLLAQKLAYEESDILILIIDDDILKKLILCRSLFGKCDDFLKMEKIKFEVEY